ncbi:MAG: thioesterase family protein [bacterium]|nr:thioesterase family protein [bacterium]
MPDTLTPTVTRPDISADEKARIMLDRLKVSFDNTPFVKLIGMELSSASNEQIKARFDMRPELVGNSVRQILHGGVIATALDMVGGMMGVVAVYQRMKDDEVPKAERYMRLAKLGTIDMRVDYLQPGRGKHFEASASLLRVGKKVFVTRMELHNDSGELIAAATGTYLY